MMSYNNRNVINPSYHPLGQQPVSSFTPAWSRPSKQIRPHIKTYWLIAGLVLMASFALIMWLLAVLYFNKSSTAAAPVSSSSAPFFVQPPSSSAATVYPSSSATPSPPSSSGRLSSSGIQSSSGQPVSSSTSFHTSSSSQSISSSLVASYSSSPSSGWGTGLPLANLVNNVPLQSSGFFDYAAQTTIGNSTTTSGTISYNTTANAMQFLTGNIKTTIIPAVSSSLCMRFMVPALAFSVIFGGNNALDTGAQYLFMSTSGVLTLEMGTTTLTGPTVSPYQTYQVCSTYNSQTVTASIWLNGALAASGVITGATAPGSTDAILIGAEYAASAGFTGQFSCFTVWNTALSASSVLALYNTQSSGTCYSPPSSSGSTTGIPLANLVNNVPLQANGFIDSITGVSISTKSTGVSYNATANAEQFVIGSIGTSIIPTVSSSLCIRFMISNLAYGAIFGGIGNNNPDSGDQFLSIGSSGILALGMGTTILLGPYLSIYQNYHVCSSYNSQTVTASIWLNGALIAAGIVFGATTPGATDAVYIGAQYGAIGGFTGQFSCFTVWNIALNASSVLALYSAQVNGVCTPP